MRATTPLTGSAQEPTTPRRMKSTLDSRWYITIGPTFKAGKAAQGLPNGSLDTRGSIYDALHRRIDYRRLPTRSLRWVNDASRPLNDWARRPRCLFQRWLLFTLDNWEKGACLV